MLCLLVNADILAVWKVAPIFQKRAGSHVVISNPFMVIYAGVLQGSISIYVHMHNLGCSMK